MRDQGRLSQTIDWTTISIYFGMVFLGWINIYAAVYDPENVKSIFDMSLNSGKQLMWISICLFLIIVPIMIIDFKVYRPLAVPGYVVALILLVAVMFLSRNIKGAHSWLEIGSVRLQPSEFAKVATALVLARFIDTPNIKMEKPLHYLTAVMIFAIPMALIVLQGDAGSALVFGAFVLVIYREGLPAAYIVIALVSIFFFVLSLFFLEDLWLLTGIIGGLVVVCVLAVVLFVRRNKPKYIITIAIGGLLSVAIVWSMTFILTDVLQEHQTKRLKVLVNPEAYVRDVGYQVNQSKIAIGSGGLLGKGFLNGTQTKFDFVPDQSTDFIFCTVGEEHGWIGSLIVITLFTLLIYRVVGIAERQKSIFSRVYGYSVACIFLIHFMINIGMTIGLFPVIGIPLPFFSYGGSSLMAFTILLFILIKMDAHRMQVLGR